MDTQSVMFQLNVRDVAKGAIVASISAILMALVSIVNQSGFDLFAINWHVVTNTVFSSAVSAFVGYLGKNFLSTDGKFLGKV